MAVQTSSPPTDDWCTDTFTAKREGQTRVAQHQQNVEDDLQLRSRLTENLKAH